MEIQKHALSVVRISQFTMERGIFGGVIPEHAKACRRSIWSTFSPGISPGAAATLLNPCMSPLVQSRLLLVSSQWI